MTPAQRRAIILAGVLGVLGLIAGTFAAHVLGGRIPAERISTFETGVRYHLYHALAILAVAGVGPMWASGLTRAAVVCFGAGVVLFAGSLYALAITDIEPLGIITPFGGVLFIIGWVLIVCAAIKQQAAS